MFYVTYEISTGRIVQINEGAPPHESFPEIFATLIVGNELQPSITNTIVDTETQTIVPMPDNFNDV